MTSASPEDSSTVELAERFRKGDRNAFADIVRANQSAVFAFLRARILQAADAEDLTQEVFLRFHSARERFDVHQPIRPWLLGIARNLIREHIRKVKRRHEVAWTAMCLELDHMLRTDDDEHEDALVHLPDCMESLGPSAREAVQLKYESNMRLSAIGAKLHRSEGAIKLLIFRARQALKHCLTGKLRRTTDDQY